MTLDNIENYWSRELQSDVEIVGRGWGHSPDDYALYIDGTYLTSFKRIDEIEDYLGKYFVLEGARAERE